METVLLTGASSGIGLHLAHEFARRGHPLVLIAPSEAELHRVAVDLQSEHKAPVRILACDLEQSNAAARVFDQLMQDEVRIDILVNNAGHGQKGRFWEIPIDRTLSILRLNVEAVLRLTALFLPPMLERGHGRILNTASVAGFEPGPMLAVYHASKAFVLSWSEALATELENTPVTSTALCPGPTDTDFFPKANMLETRGFQQANLMAPQDVAAAGYEGLMRGERIVVPGAANKAMVFSRRFMSEHMQSKLNEKLYEDVPPEKHKRERGDMERRAHK
ncbi:MAG TPA: SDR family oxidoreductase [Rudaea sp.]|nr:SDR family oxidoreductase [Rudaea sp.]